MYATNKIREGLPALPDRIQRLPVDERGYPVPWFVAWIDGKPEFRTIDPRKVKAAVQQKRCWVCGEYLGRYMVFVIGPMCAINRISGEPPSHKDCAEFSALACPFLTKPHMVRRTNDLPEGHVVNEAHIDRNPGVTMLWTTFAYSLVPVSTGVLFRIGDPLIIECYREGRKAFSHEVRESIDSGFPLLYEEAEKEGQAAKDEAIRRRDEVYRLLGC